MSNKQKSIIYSGIVLTFLIVSMGTVASASTPQVEEWNMTFDFGEAEYANFVQQTTDGGYISVGQVHVLGHGNNAFLVKTDSNGNEEWNHTFGRDISNDYGCSVQQTTDGGYVFSGRTYVTGDSSDAWLVKTDPEGTEEWNHTFGVVPGNDNAQSVQQTIDGGYILAGYTKVPGNGNDAWLIKTDSKGYEEWNNTFGGLYFDVVYSVQQTTDGGFILSGETSGSDYISDAWLIKTDPNGCEEWNNTFGVAAYNDLAFTVRQTLDDGFITTGYTYVPSNGYEAWLIKTDFYGNEEWNSTFGGIGTDFSSSVQQTIDGGFVVVGYTNSFGAGDWDAWLIKTNSEGTEEWNRTFGGADSDFASSVQQTRDGGFILSGRTESFGEGAWLIKTETVDPSERIKALIDYVNSLDVGNGAKQPIISPLGASLGQLNLGNEAVAITHLGNAIDATDRGLTSRVLTEEQIEYISNEAKLIIELIGNLEG